MLERLASGGARRVASIIELAYWRHGPRLCMAEGDGGAGGGGTGAGAGAGGGNSGTGGGAAPGAAAGGASPSAGGAPGGQAAGGDKAAPTGAAGYRPEGLPDHFAGKSDKETIDNLFKAVDGFRRVEGDRGAVPKAIDDYKFEPSDKLKPFVSNFDKDPIYKGAREDALAAGITDKQFAKFLPAVLGRFVEGGLVAQPINATAELMKLAPEAKYADDKERLTAGSQRLNDNIAWVDGAKANKTMPDAVAEFFAAQLTDQLGAHAVIDWLRGRERPIGPALGGGSTGGGQSDADLTARLNDPRGNPSAAEFDRSFANETDRLYQKRYGN